MFQNFDRLTRVFTGDKIRRPQNLKGPDRNIAKVPDGSRNKTQHIKSFNIS